MTELPAAVATTIKALRTAATWLPDEQRDLLYEAADNCERAWNGPCCPVCEEQTCDAGCPLEDLGAEALRNCDGRHPGIAHDGSMVYMYDLVTHAGCPHQPWAKPEPNPTKAILRAYVEAKDALAASLRETASLVDDASPAEAALGGVASVVAGQLEAYSPIRAILWPSFGALAELQAPCYRTASGAAVHVRPSCRC